MATLPDLTKMSHEQLMAEVLRLREAKNAPAIAWAKDKDGNDKDNAVNITFPGKRARYLEVDELTYLIEHGTSLLEDLLTKS